MSPMSFLAQRFAKAVVCISLLFCLAAPQKASAEPMREFVLSCTYGVLAGTLVGAAALAFTTTPGDNLNMVARGASIGLYAGIFLGAYIVFGVPSGEEDPSSVAVASFRAPRFLVMPLVSQQRGLEGAAAQYEVLRF